MSASKGAAAGASEPAVPAVWWLIFKREVAELWLGGRGFNLLILFSVLMGVTAYLVATNSELNLMSAGELQFIVLQAVMTFGLFLGLIIAAESISGERERTTLEALLLTPTSRRQIVLGKYLGALTLWPAALALAMPYMVILAQGNAVLGPALFWGSLLGTVLALIFTGIGMIVSIWSGTSRTSLFVALLVYLLSLLPTQLPGEVQATPFGMLMQASGPLEAAKQFLLRTLSNGDPVSSVLIFLLMPIASAVLVLAVLFFYAAPRLTFDGARLNLPRLFQSRRDKETR